MHFAITLKSSEVLLMDHATLGTCQQSPSQLCSKQVACTPGDHAIAGLRGHTANLIGCKLSHRLSHEISWGFSLVEGGRTNQPALGGRDLHAEGTKSSCSVATMGRAARTSCTFWILQRLRPVRYTVTIR